MVNDFYGYYQTWSSLGVDFLGKAPDLGRTAPAHHSAAVSENRPGAAADPLPGRSAISAGSATSTYLRSTTSRRFGPFASRCWSSSMARRVTDQLACPASGPAAYG